MLVLLYDKTFDGFLTVIFEIFRNKFKPDRIESLEFGDQILWAERIAISTEPDKANRVWEALKTRLTNRAYNAVYRIHLSGMKDAEMILYRFMQKVFASPVNIEENYGDTAVLKIRKLDQQICREAERIRQFVRFQKTADGIYYALMDPQYNVIPMVIKHFESRFADQQWIIYDSNRNYGFYYNCKETMVIHLTSDKVNPLNGKISNDILDEEELHFQQLWKKYFKATCIEERRNEKLQMQHMPKKYWKYLTEKQD